MIFVKTDAGQASFKERSPRFTPRQRLTFILVDGHKSVDELLLATAGIGATMADIEAMVEQGFLTIASHPDVVTLPGHLETAPMSLDGMALPVRSEQERYQAAKILATQITAKLGLKGFMLNLSVESAAGYAELLALLPKIRAAAGDQACKDLESAFKG